MNKRKIVVSLGILLLLSNIVFSLYIYQQLNNIIIIDVIRLVNEFDMKKELESKVENKLNNYKFQLDSLEAVINNRTKVGNNNEIDQLISSYKSLQLEGIKAYENSNKNINEQVWKRLNPLIDEYSKKNNCRILIGANGMGTVLYNDNKTDKTTELIQFVNSKYEKGH